MSQHQAASGQFDRAVNPADGVGSLKQAPTNTSGPRGNGRLVYNGADRDGQDGNPGFTQLDQHRDEIHRRCTAGRSERLKERHDAVGPQRLSTPKESALTR